MSFLRTSVPKSLRESVLGDSLPTAELRRLAGLSTIINVSDGDKIIAESTPGRECFVVLDGEFSVTSDDVDAQVGAGEVAGELALLTGRPRNASVIASSDSAVCVMHPREFATLLSEAEQFRASVVSTAHARLGGDSVTLPAQFVRRYGASAALAAPWSERLAGVKRWKPQD